MSVKLNEAGRMVYSYKLKKGISKIRGGMEILKQMNYPEEILRDLANTRK
jgi:DNA mismatch repair ATPase MutS